MQTTVSTYNTHFDGEVFLEERNNTWNTPFLFNGKELDEETGLYYYGARYYNPRISLWYGVDPLAEKYPSVSAYAYCVNNPVMLVDPTGMDWELPGEQEAQDAYVRMLHALTGNNYSIGENNRLTLVGEDPEFTGEKSQTLINTIERGMDSENTYTLSLVGAEGDDFGVFIDSYTEARIDVSDLRMLGEISTALQGVVIGHFLNEVQENTGYSTATPEERGRMFDDAHSPSLRVEGRIYGELVGDNTITTRRDYSIEAPQNGTQPVIFEYNSTNRFQLQQGATSRTTISNELNGVRFPFPISTITTISTGELRSVTRLP